MVNKNLKKRITFLNYSYRSKNFSLIFLISAGLEILFWEHALNPYIYLNSKAFFLGGGMPPGFS